MRRRSRSRWRFPTALAFLLATASAKAPCAAAAEATGRSRRAIQGGTADTLSTWVLGIVNEHHGTACTGSLLAPNLFMTTRHCIDFPLNTPVDCGPCQRQ